MTERVNKGKHKRSLSLSRSKKKKGDGTAANAAATTPITSFFSQSPPKLACPLCGLLVPKYKINEHIDLQCQNFEREDSSAASASNTVVPSIHLSPKRSPTKSPELNSRKEEIEDTKTSPYFKKNIQQASREITSKSVVRTIDLGRLSSKLSRKRYQVSENTLAQDNHALTSPDKETTLETLDSSQKENLIHTLEEDCVILSAPTKSIVEASKAVADLSCFERGGSVDSKPFKSETVQPPVAPKLPSPPSKLAKRKKKTTDTSSVSGFSKKARFERSNRDTEVVLSGEEHAETADRCQNGTGEPSNASRDPPLSSDEAYETHAAVIDSDAVVEKPPIGQAVESSHSPQLPYYLRNFHTVLEAVLENEDDRELFNQEDMAFVHTFEKLSGMVKHPSVAMK